MNAEHRVKLFRSGQGQVVRIPQEFELPGDRVIMRKEGGRLIIEPVAPSSLLALLSTLKPIEDEFGPIADLPADSFDF